MHAIKITELEAYSRLTIPLNFSSIRPTLIPPLYWALVIPTHDFFFFPTVFYQFSTAIPLFQL